MIGVAGVAVSRMIPKDVLLGLLSGAYRLHGGVVRDMSGRIVSHLVVPSNALNLMPGLSWIAEAFQAYQLHTMGLKLDRVSAKLGQVMQLSMATTAFSGLGLVVSVSGFLFLNRKMGEIRAAVDRIEKNTRKTNHLLEAVTYGQLKAAIDTLQTAQLTSDPGLRQDMLIQSKDKFLCLQHEYERLWNKLDQSEDREALDDSWSISMVGHGLVSNELGLGQSASQAFDTHHQVWRENVRTYCKDVALGEKPERLLHPRYLEVMPTAELISLLDFANEEDKGLLWLDELRFRAGESSMLKLPKFSLDTDPLKLARKLLAKDVVLGSFAAHFKFLNDQGLRSSEFLSRIEAEAQEVHSDGPVWVTADGAVLRPSCSGV
ncbi:hypothetical protein [Roseateles oligotrophus]|uniref:Uncharacterized protein n=1 Tax=Roseateles oligotrophus TaxID=1769250 RepID=A0ABT2YJJ5_9BURK|nr:hypothetical protein [Roseateles oligotrophus]MCV2370229.1 hypothetical protein [Roseateles oligotrophus]